MCSLVYPYAVKHFKEKTLTLGEIKAAIAATGEGYSFPTNLDSDPTGGLAPRPAGIFHEGTAKQYG